MIKSPTATVVYLTNNFNHLNDPSTLALFESGPNRDFLSYFLKVFDNALRTGITVQLFKSGRGLGAVPNIEPQNEEKVYKAVLASRRGIDVYQQIGIGAPTISLNGDPIDATDSILFAQSNSDNYIAELPGLPLPEAKLSLATGRTLLNLFGSSTLRQLHTVQPLAEIADPSFVFAEQRDPRRQQIFTFGTDAMYWEAALQNQVNPFYSLPSSPAV